MVMRGTIEYALAAAPAGWVSPWLEERLKLGGGLRRGLVEADGWEADASVAADATATRAAMGKLESDGAARPPSTAMLLL
jgi:hypothetical protein